jgi:hypothetical protein
MSVQAAEALALGIAWLQICSAARQSVGIATPCPDIIVTSFTSVESAKIGIGRKISVSHEIYISLSIMDNREF